MDDISLIFSRFCKTYLPWFAVYSVAVSLLRWLTGLVFLLLCFWVLTWGVRFIIGRSQDSRILHRPYGFLRLCCPAVYSARTLGTSTHPHSFLSPTLPGVPPIPRQGIVVNLHTLQALRLIGYGKAAHRFLFIRLYAFHPRELLLYASFRYAFCLNYFTVTVGTQAPDFSTAYLQRKFFPIRGHLILLNMFLFLFTQLFIFI
jgi:hypothetical protein